MRIRIAPLYAALFAALVLSFCLALVGSRAFASAPHVALQQTTSAQLAPVATCTPSTDYTITRTTGATIDPGTSYTGNNCDDCVTPITLPFAYNFYGIPYTHIYAGSNGDILFSTTNPDFENTCLPADSPRNAILAYWDDLSTSNTISASLGIFTSVVGASPNRIYNVEWRAAYLSDTTRRANFEVRLYEGQSRFDVIYGQVDEGGSGATVGVQRGANMPYTQYECNTPGSVSPGTQLSFQIQTCSLPENTPTPIPTPSACGVDANFVAASSTGAAIVPGTTLVPNSQGDDRVAQVALPFVFRFYGQQFSSVNASTNGNLQFSSANETFFNNTCLPSQFVNNVIAPHWDDLDTSLGITTTFTPGIYTSITGVAPNRIFNVEWRACLFLGVGSCDGYVNFEARLYETGEQFDFVYGSVAGAGTGATVGVQKGLGLRSTQYECNTGGITPGLRLNFTLPVCAGTPTPTPVCPPLSGIKQVIGLNSPGQSKLVHNSQTGASRLSSEPGTAVVKSVIDPSAGFQPLGPISLLVDDGSRENSVGFGQGTLTETAAIWLNRFTPGGLNYPLTINSISVFWPAQAITGTVVGKTARLLVYADTDGDNNPSNATLVQQQSVTIGTEGAFENYAVNIPVAGPGDLYIGVEDQWAESGYAPRLFPIAQDTTTPRARSWIAAQSTSAAPNITSLALNDVLGTSDALDLSGNFMIRAAATTASTTCPTSTPTSTAVPPTPNAATPTGTSTATPAATFTATATATPGGATLIGHVTWQGAPAQPSTRQQQAITLTLKLGNTEVNYATQNTDASGFFTVTTGALAPGTYGWRVKGPRSLANAGTVPLTAGTNRQEMGLLLTGDANNDNRANATDFNIVKATLGKGCGDLGYDGRGDFSNDCLVNTSDFNLLKANFGQGGAGPLLPGR